MKPEDLARLFHETYERLAPSRGYQTRKASAVPWEDVPEANKSLMIAVAAEVGQVIEQQALAEVTRLRGLLGHLEEAARKSLNLQSSMLQELTAARGES